MSETPVLSFIKTDSGSPDFVTLAALLDQDLAIRDGDEHAFYAHFNKAYDIRHVIICYYENKPIACGAFKAFDDQSAEIKRMFVLPEHRGRGAGLQVLQQLENWVADSGYRYAVLETGKKQPEAIALYKKAGYHIIPNYGQYAGIENSVCMKKEIAP